MSETAARPAPQGVGEALSKVPQITLVFWIVKICATTVGETGGDALSMSLNLGYLTSTLIFLGFFLVTLAVQLAAKRYHPWAYWLVVVGTTLVGTTTSDFLDRTVGLGYVKSTAAEFAAVIAMLIIWRFATGRIAADHISDRKNESFYWVTILVSNTLGTALGDFTADDTGLNLGFEKGALLFIALLAVVAAARYLTRIPPAILFWAAYILTRPLGATLGDTLTKPFSQGGLHLDRFVAAGSIGLAMVIILVVSHALRPAKPGEVLP
ncbi:MAG TPA: hypothetical protein VME40_18345 [Caulobacteraceae bacterium]|nr:hypothetical protein [Caulobacteraceae bacterium]